MLSSAFLLAAALLGQASCHPFDPQHHDKHAVGAPPGGDITILNYALTLEYLERKFYLEGLNNYTEADFCNAGFEPDLYENIKRLYFDERTHVKFLTEALGNDAIGEPTFSYPVSCPEEFVSLANVLEGVGVSAYLGALAEISNPNYLTAAGSILSVEARHSSYIRRVLGRSGFPNPFETPLDFNQVYSLASSFIVSFAPGTTLPFQAFPPLTIEGGCPNHENCFCAGQSEIIFYNAYKCAKEAGLVDDHTQIYAVFFSGLQVYYVPVSICGDDYVATVPGANYDCPDQPAPAGQVYVLLSTADGKGMSFSDDNTISGVGVFETCNDS